ncbi:hypothetical protein RRG08_021525 [Elysia crispata]|uniref:Uncharacterized protein n=1 Tax=Elysia crispata TaxID=231223 RepID=A0AAE1CMV7_9GAST|nr:hypothetical protein RRG08_021525 [Elysia crispata]
MRGLIQTLQRSLMRSLSQTVQGLTAGPQPNIARLEEGISQTLQRLDVGPPKPETCARLDVGLSQTLQGN